MAKKHPLLVCGAGLCWSISVAVIIGSLISDEIREDNLYGRVCILSGLLGAVLTSRLWNARKVVHVPVPAEDVYGMGMKTGIKIGELKASGCTPKGQPFDQEWASDLTARMSEIPPFGRQYN